MTSSTVRLLAAALVCATSFAPRAIAQDAPTKKKHAPGSDTAMFVPFDFYARHGKALSLTSDQQQAQRQIGDSLQADARRLEEDRLRRTQALQTLLAQNPVEVDRAMAAFRAVLEAENELKALQFRSGLAMRNTLTPAQLAQVAELAAKDSADRIGGARAALARRVQELRSEVHQRTNGNPPAEIVARIEQVETSAREGRFSEAKTQLESVLRRLRGEPEPGSPADVSQSPPPPAK
jgi:Spy/CpxP family protein refolding chaperone